MKTLIVIPLQKELDAFLQGCETHRVVINKGNLGRLPTARLPNYNLTLACGGLGKAQFGVQTQHLLEQEEGWNLVICAGAAGGLADAVAVGDIVIGTETIEHDINNKFGPPRLPRFAAPQAVINSLTAIDLTKLNFRVHTGPIAAGDEDVVDSDRRAALVARTRALSVAWEGAGGARACQFSQVPFVEIRSITDGADSTAAADFKSNLAFAMHNLATFILTWQQTR